MRRSDTSFGEFVGLSMRFPDVSTRLELRIEKGVDSYFVGFRRRRTSIPLMPVAESGLFHDNGSESNSFPHHRTAVISEKK